KRLMDHQRSFTDAIKTSPFNGIEIEVKIIRSVDVIATRVPGVEIDAAEIDGPKQGSQVADDREVDHASFRVLNRTGINPLRPRHRGSFLEKKRAARAIWVTLHDHR